ncbi:hypothetical protein [Lentzea terrae]|uniref:hypothetical protein n=1 Tax=Lentzea terrae TaxID=2200761 RepID=UPI000DD3DD34|nr:hypothetical protein [Lentzea terrae]
MSGGFGVDLDALKAAETGITNTVAELRKAGYHGQERSGQTVVTFKLDLEETGHQVITDGLDEVLDRYHWWVRGLIEGTEEFVQALADTRSTYQRAEDQVLSSLKSLADMTFLANPLGQQQAPSGAQCRPEAPR